MADQASAPTAQEIHVVPGFGGGLVKLVLGAGLIVVVLYFTQELWNTLLPVAVIVCFLLIGMGLMKDGTLALWGEGLTRVFRAAVAKADASPELESKG